jgi:hypothetical protein
MARYGRRTIKDTVEPVERGKLRLYAQLGLRIPAEIAVRLKRYCQETGKSVNQAVMEALTQFLTENGR